MTMIEVPVFVSFNADNAKQASSGSNHVFGLTITLRYDDIQGGDPKVEYCIGYPPNPRSIWNEDRDQIFHYLMPSRADKAISDLAHRHPEDYYADPIAAKIRVEELEQERDGA